MSRYVELQRDRKFIFGWDPPLGTFFLQIHDMQKPEEDRIIYWLGATRETAMKEVEELVRAASEYGLVISRKIQFQLYKERDEDI